MKLASLSLEKATCNEGKCSDPSSNWAGWFTKNKQPKTHFCDNNSVEFFGISGYTMFNWFSIFMESLNYLYKKQKETVLISAQVKFSNLADIMLHSDCNLAKKERSLMFLGESRER